MKKHILSIIYGIVLTGFTVYMFSFAFPLIGGALLFGYCSICAAYVKKQPPVINELLIGFLVRGRPFLYI